ncbi:MAG: dephospho-CoA kinase [Flavihumibacter sp.]
MLRIGITGGIGSGKSVVARVFENLGIPVYNADNAAKILMETDPSLREKITALFGSEAYENNRLNRAFIAARVFNNQEKLEALNAAVHPVVIRYGEEWFNRQSAPYAIKEAALFFETGTAAQLDKVIGVYAPPTLRLRRVMQRDGLTREQIKSRMDKQIDESLKMRLCDHVILNDDQHLVIPQVLALDALFRGL